MVRQIVMHYVLVIFLTLLLGITVFTISIRTYYYDNIFNFIQSHIYAKKNFEEGFLSTRESQKKRDIYELLKNFSLDKTELQILDVHGHILESTSRFDSRPGALLTDDVLKAIGSDDTGKWMGRQAGTEEEVMAVSQKVHLGKDLVYVVRYVTSLKAVNEQIQLLMLIAVGVSVLILGIVLLVSIGMANSIVRPIQHIISTSKQMAQGNFSVRITEHYKYELKELAHTLNYIAQEILRSNEVKDHFISSISHELRTPLTSIKGWSETLKSGGFHVDETTRGINIIAKETDRLILLVEEILDFSKLQQEQMKLVKQSVSVKEIIQEIMLNVWAKAEKKQLHIQLTVQEEEKPYIIQGDANRLKQIFLNIVDNAIKFSHENAGIYLMLKEEEKQVVVVTQDTGIGINEQYLPKVGDRFFQVNHQNGGTGLGLSITQQLVKLHEGSITIQSKLGVGTTVTVCLPIGMN